jgi:hypothetical protein
MIFCTLTGVYIYSSGLSRFTTNFPKIHRSHILYIAFHALSFAGTTTYPRIGSPHEKHALSTTVISSSSLPYPVSQAVTPNDAK